MNLRVMFVLGAVVSTSLFAPAVNADTITSVTTSSEAVPTTVLETRSTTVESTPVMIREQPVVIMQQPASREVIVIKKKHSHHLINVGPIKVF
jgi:hypothetical protein